MLGASSSPSFARWRAALIFFVLSSFLLSHTISSSSVIDVDSRVRQQWNALTTTICPDRAYISCRPPMDRTPWTLANATKITDQKFMGLGTWSTFKMVSHDHAGARKTKGGDSFFVLLRDRRTNLKVSTRVFDEGDGTYTVAVFLLKPGKYSVSAWLW